MKRRTFIKGFGAMFGLAGGSAIYAHEIEPYNLEIHNVRLKLNLDKELKIAALSDLHFDPLYEIDYLTTVAQAVSDLEPDIVVNTGDMFSHDSSRADELANILSIPKPPLGSFAVLGNHDFWSNASHIQKTLESHGIRVLRNETFPIPGFDEVYLTGLESYWAGKPDPSITSQTSLDSRHILLIHEPDPFASLDDIRIKLQISGHTHGGQIRLPLLGAMRLPSWGKNYDKGLFHKNERYLYVNRGIGTVDPHVRFNCKPEITFFILS